MLAKGVKNEYHRFLIQRTEKPNDFALGEKHSSRLDYFVSAAIKRETIFALFSASGIPPPGCTVTPEKYNPFNDFEKLGCR